SGNHCRHQGEPGRTVFNGYHKTIQGERVPKSFDRRTYPVRKSGGLSVYHGDNQTWKFISTQYGKERLFTDVPASRTQKPAINIMGGFSSANVENYIRNSTK